MRTIRTARLRLEPVNAGNAGSLWDVLQAPDLRDYQDLPNVNRATFVRMVGARPRRLTSGVTGRFEWLLHYANGSDILGWVSLRIADGDSSTAEIGYSVVRPYRRRGIASEAVAALVEEGFRRTQVRRIRAYCLPDNVASRAVLKRTGFRDEGMLPRGAMVHGKPVDVITHSFAREQWAGSYVEPGGHSIVTPAS